MSILDNYVYVPEAVYPLHLSNTGDTYMVKDSNNQVVLMDRGLLDKVELEYIMNALEFYKKAQLLNGMIDG